MRLQHHFVAARRRQLILRVKLANAQKDQTAVFGSLKIHASETHARAAASLVREDDLIRGQRDSQTVWTHHERAGRPIPDDWKLRHTIPLSMKGRARCELD